MGLREPRAVRADRAGAPFGRTVRALFPFGYFMAYEYVALSRCYGLALLLALLLCVRHSRRREHPAATAGLLAALALTATVSTVVAAAYTVALGVERLVAVRRGERAATSAWVPVGVGAVACLAAALLAWPPADSTVAHVAWPKQLPDDAAPTRVLVALFPIPRIEFFFWNSNLLLSWAPFRAVALPVAIALAVAIVVCLSRDRTAAILFGVGSLLLVALFGGVYGGDVRHHGFFFVLLVMGAWIVRESTEGEARPHVRDAALGTLLATVLAAHVAATPVALYYDYRYVFSSGGRAATALRERGLASAPLVAEVDYPATAVIGQLGGHVFAYSPRTGRPFSFVQWTRDRRREASDEETLRYASALGSSRGEDAVVLMNRPLRPDLVDGRGVRRVAELFDSMIEEENFYVYRVARDAAPAPQSVPSSGSPIVSKAQ